MESFALFYLLMSFQLPISFTHTRADVIVIKMISSRFDKLPLITTALTRSAQNYR